MGELLVGPVLTALLAGVVALLAPCCVSVMPPAYLSTVFRRPAGVLAATLVFAAGVATVIVPIGLGASALSAALQRWHLPLFAGGGLLMVAGGVAVVADYGGGWAMTTVTLLTQPDCPMCAHAKRFLARVGADHPITVQEVDLHTRRVPGWHTAPGCCSPRRPHRRSAVRVRAAVRTGAAPRPHRDHRISTDEGVTTMDKLVYLLPILGCAAMMGAMMWMMRGQHGQTHATHPDAAAAQTAEEIALLRAEVAVLREQQRAGSDEPADEQAGSPR